MLGVSASPPELDHVDTWIFDLDETLYDRESGVLSAMEGRIDSWLARTTGLGPAEVLALRLSMREEHGSTMAALLAEGSADIDAYQRYVHDLPLDMMRPDLPLRAALLRLPGRRLVHTNAPGFHADRVLAALGLEGVFDAVFHCEAAEYALKPKLEAFTRIVAAHTLDPATCAFFEDREANLKAAAGLGMVTVLVGADAAESTADWVSYRTPALTPFLQSIQFEEA